MLSTPAKPAKPSLRLSRSTLLLSTIVSIRKEHPASAASPTGKAPQLPRLPRDRGNSSLTASLRQVGLPRSLRRYPLGVLGPKTLPQPTKCISPPPSSITASPSRLREPSKTAAKDLFFPDTTGDEESLPPTSLPPFFLYFLLFRRYAKGSEDGLPPNPSFFFLCLVPLGLASSSFFLLSPSIPTTPTRWLNSPDSPTRSPSDGSLRGNLPLRACVSEVSRVPPHLIHSPSPTA